jgi:hypothetical protein
MTWWEKTGYTVGAIAGFLGLIGAVGAALVKAGRSLRRIGRFLDQWLGHGEGRHRAPGVIERLDIQDQELARIRGQVLPNGGSSLRDVVDEVRRRLDDHLIDAERSRLELQQHLREHP